ncbi:unnamed protein product [Closterium sp. Naga37s-1]|nr:unnamed protein product [Closterium sp. Naga37s-1]
MERPVPLLVEDILEAGRMPAPVTQPDHPTQFACNEVGKPRQAWPTFVSYEGAAAFKMHGEDPGPGLVYDCTAGEWQEPTALERELAMGFMEDATAHPETQIWLPAAREEAAVDKKREDLDWVEEAIERQRRRESYEREFGSREFALMAATKEEGVETKTQGGHVEEKA